MVKLIVIAYLVYTAPSIQLVPNPAGDYGVNRSTTNTFNTMEECEVIAERYRKASNRTIKFNASCVDVKP